MWGLANDGGTSPPKGSDFSNLLGKTHFGGPLFSSGGGGEGENPPEEGRFQFIIFALGKQKKFYKKGGGRSFLSFLFLWFISGAFSFGLFFFPSATNLFFAYLTPHFFF